MLMYLIPWTIWSLIACMRPEFDASGVLEVDLVLPRNDTYAPLLVHALCLLPDAMVLPFYFIYNTEEQASGGDRI